VGALCDLPSLTVLPQGSFGIGGSHQRLPPLSQTVSSYLLPTFIIFLSRNLLTSQTINSSFLLSQTLPTYSQGTGRERYVFFSFPHIGIDDSGEVGAISRPGRPKVSHACGALLKALSEVKSEGVGRNFSIPGR